MLSLSPSSPLLLLLALLLSRGVAQDCLDTFRTGRDDFVLNVKASVQDGAALLATAYVNSKAECKNVCCGHPHCNLALLEPSGAGTAAENRTCDLFDCIYGNRFVCRFVKQAGYLSYIREPLFQKYLDCPQRPGKLAPPIADAGRDIVVQPGETVMLNGIESLALGDAKILDYSWSLESGGEDVIMEETDLPDQMKLSNLQAGIYVFKLTITDSNDKKDEATVEVYVLTLQQSSLYCLSPVKVGSCRAAFPRWHYNAVTKHCELFIFGGCKPNKNNYLSNEECMAACRGVSALSERSLTLTASCNSTCPHDHLICNGSCCLDQSLECDGVTHCSDGADELYCSKLNHTFSRLLSIDVNQEKAQCTQSPHTGPCRASHIRWYYDPLRQKCYRFVFGGCNENENNFENEEKCLKSCDGVTESSVFSRGIFQYYESNNESNNEEDNSGHIALAVILTVAILALVAVVVYCVLKKQRERSHQPVATSPVHMTLSEQDTLVYNSTTKPV